MFVDKFSKTQSGKVVRRIAQSIYEDENICDL